MHGDLTPAEPLPGTSGNINGREKDRRKFVDLANKRVSKALQTIRLIGNLSNRSNYDFTEEDVAKIFRALHEEIGACRKRFDLALDKQGSKKLFTLE